ncbi:MAG: putative Ig domain-containing protein, partial [Methanomassiliicoccaceae archaeon]|nr:putative Ig domain-containing protein [Methanomassiliicoccaceae archaeon]
MTKENAEPDPRGPGRNSAVTERREGSRTGITKELRTGRAETRTSGTKASGTRASNAKASDTRASGSRASETRTAVTRASDTRASDTRASDTRTPRNVKTGTATRSKVLISAFAVLVLLTASLSVISDGNDERTIGIGTGDDPTVYVTDITDVPSSVLVGIPLTLTGTVLPVNATDKTIAWSIKDAGATGASLSGNILNVTGEGTLTVTASIDERHQFAMVSAGSMHTMAIRSDGTLWGWGDNEAGQIGLGPDIKITSIPARVGDADDWICVSAGSYFTIALNSKGELWSCGSNLYGQLGQKDRESRNILTRIGNANDWSSVSAGGGNVTAINTNGELWMWGDNFHGQLGFDISVAGSVSTPTRVGTDNDWAFSAANDHTMAIKKNGTLWAWGLNDTGQLGLGDNADRNTPVQVGTDTWKTVAIRQQHTIAVNTNGELWSWGDNKHGQLGLGTVGGGVNSPTRVGDTDDWSLAAMGREHTAAIKTNGELWAWGDNRSGQLGFVTAENKTGVPARVGDADNWTQISIGAYHTAAANAEGELLLWGLNYFGQLGSGKLNLGGTADVPTKTVTDFTKDFVMTAVDGNHQYDIIGSGGSFTVIRYLTDGTSHILNGAVNVSLEDAADAIRKNAKGNACEITLGKNGILDIGAASMNFGDASPAWGDVTLSGAVTSSAPADGVITITGNVTIINIADITNTGGGNAIMSNVNGNVVLCGSISIIGDIHVAPGTLSVLTTGSDAFAPSHADTYSVFISGTLSAGIVAVTDGAAFAERFESANHTWMFEAKNKDLVLMNDPDHWFKVTFDPNNGDGTWNEYVLISLPSTLTKPEGAWKKDGYVSNGKWYIGGVTEFVFGTTLVIENTTLYLDWTPAGVTISTTTIADGEFNRIYASTITASLEGGAGGPINYELISGNLPPGLIFDELTGSISGIPKDVGEYTFTVRAVSVITGESDEKTFTMEVTGGYYYWNDDPANKFGSLADAMASGGSGKLTASGTFTDDLGTAGPIVFDR